MKISVTARQLEVLHAVCRVEVSKVNHTGADFGTWRLGGYRGRAVTVPTESLIRKGLVKIADAPADGRLFAVVTQAGYALLSQEARRG